MAIDTKQKRASATNYLMPFRSYVVSDTTSGVDQEERQAAAGAYSGITAQIISTGGGGRKLLLMGVR